MKIIQVLNNNVLLVEDGNDKQQIIWGKGIGFKSKQDENYVPKKDDHIFLPISKKDNHWIDPFVELSNEIPRSYFELTDAIIDLARKTIKSEFDGHLLVPLTDHIYFAVQRAKQVLNVTNPMLFDIKRYFSKEYEVGLRASQMVENLGNVTFTNDEASFIAMHLIEHELSTSESSVESVSQCLGILSKVNSILEHDFGDDFSKSSIAASRMATHLYYLLLRAQENHEVSSSKKDETELLHHLLLTYPKIGKSFERIIKYIEVTLNYKFNDSDKLFLLIHVIHIIK